ncbi:MAG: LysR family transcriptional regulator [Proteobacteria bacterium]|nr:LysR family transcriptional regulator [Pseudomonadota bacterium]
MHAQVDLKRMRYIVEVARAEAITTAAETLGLTQPALTRSINEVENTLETRLFHRLPRGVQLTDAGKRFVERARLILGDVDDLVSDIRAGNNVPTGRIRLGAVPAGYLNFAIPALKKLAGAHPGIKIEVVSGTPQALCPKLLHGELNAIIGSSSYLNRWKELKVTTLMPMQFACMVRRNHPLAKIPKPRETDMLSYPMIMPASVEAVYSDIAQRYLHHGLSPLQPQYVTDDFDLASALVKSTDAFYPVHFPDAGVGNLFDDFVLLKGIVQMPDHYISLGTSSLYPKSEAVKLFETHLLEGFERAKVRNAR